MNNPINLLNIDKAFDEQFGHLYKLVTKSTQTPTNDERLSAYYEKMNLLYQKEQIKDKLGADND